MIHRDVKAQNILLLGLGASAGAHADNYAICWTNRVKLADFGTGTYQYTWRYKTLFC